MNIYDFIQLVLFFGVLILVTPVLGGFMANVFAGNYLVNGDRQKSIKWIHPLIWFEKLVYRICGISHNSQMNWSTYSFALLLFNFLGFLIVFLLQVTQKYLPLNPQNLDNVSPALAFNTAVSFVTNTNWQSYAGETTLSYFVQMLGLTVQNFVSAATGFAVILALIRGIKNHSSENLGNFWVDLTRSLIYILIPGTVIIAILLVSQGVVQTFDHYQQITTIEGAKQIIPLGPAASQVAIKMLGTNGGGFFNANSAHPFENPTPLSNFIEMFALMIIPMSLTYTFGKLVGLIKQGWSLFAAMLIMCLFGMAVMLISEYSFNPVMHTSGIMEGKEQRLGITNSVLFSNITTDVSCGAVNNMHSSLSPLAGMISLVNIMLGEVIFGGVGAGMYGMLVFVFLTVFIAGLMVGRTPEYLGKKIESPEVKMSILAILAPNFVILVFSAIALMVPQGLSGILNHGPHGLSEVLYAFSSAAGNNGSAFAGLNANTNFYNIMLGTGMLIGRFAVIIPVMAIAGSLSKKKIIPQSGGTLKTNIFLFVFLLIAVILIVGALTHFPALSLGPIVEHFLMTGGRTF